MKILKNSEQKRLWYAGLLSLFIAFNIWHAAKRGIWDPISVIDSLHLSKKIVLRLNRFDSQIRISAKPYDGQYIYAATYDPLIINKTVLDVIDQPVYRYRRMLYPLCANIISLGLPWIYPYALFAINVFSYLLGGYAVWKLIKLNRWTLWLLLGYFSNTGLLYSTFGTLTEPLGMCLMLSGIFFWQKNNYKIGILFFALSVLARETYILIPISILFFELWFGTNSVRNIIMYGLFIIAPFALWFLYIHVRLASHHYLPSTSEMPPSLGWGRFSLPFVGLWQETVFGIKHLTTQSNIRLTLGISIMATFCGILSIVWILLKKDIWGIITVIQALFVVSTRGDVWNYHAGSARVAIPLFFFAMVYCADQIKSQAPSPQGLIKLPG